MSGSSERSGNDVPEADLVRIVAYLDGALSHDEARALEVRLGTEPPLARAFEELAGAHDELAAALGADGARPRASTRRMALLVAGAAALAVALSAPWWIARTRTAPGFDVAVVRTAPADADLNEMLGFASDWLPDGMGYRDAGDGEAPAADVWAEAVGGELQKRAEDALEGRAQVPRADSFVIALEPATDCHVVLVLASPGRPRERLLPRGDASHGALAGGRTHLLPAEPLRLPDDWRRTRRADYDPGILTRAGADVTLGVRAAAIPAELLRELDELLARDRTDVDGQAVRGWLEERGFTVREISVDPLDGG